MDEIESENENENYEKKLEWKEQFIRLLCWQTLH